MPGPITHQVRGKLWCKLTDEFGQTYAGTQWGDGVSHRAAGEGTEFCTGGLIHFYSHPLVALLHNPMHVAFKNPLLWAVQAAGPVYSDRGLKHGAKQVTTLHTIPTPSLSQDVRIRYSILCAKLVYKDTVWILWADNWLNGRDRNAAAAYAASAPAYYAAAVAASAAASAAAVAASAAASASAVAASASAYAASAVAASAAASAYYADAAAAVAVAVTEAATYAAQAAHYEIDFPRLAELALAGEEDPAAYRRIWKSYRRI